MIFVLNPEISANELSVARIDIASYIGEFEIQLTLDEGDNLRNAWWHPKGYENAGWVATREVGEEWAPILVSFTPEKSGKVVLFFRADIDKGRVWIDDLLSEGLDFLNPGFEIIDGGVRFRSWGIFRTSSRDGTIARTGKSCVSLAHDETIRIVVDVESGKTYRVGAWFREGAE